MGLTETEKTDCTASCAVKEQMGQRNRGLNVAGVGTKTTAFGFGGWFKLIRIWNKMSFLQSFKNNLCNLPILFSNNFTIYTTLILHL